MAITIAFCFVICLCCITQLIDIIITDWMNKGKPKLKQYFKTFKHIKNKNITDDQNKDQK